MSDVLYGIEKYYMHKLVPYERISGTSRRYQDIMFLKKFGTYGYSFYFGIRRHGKNKVGVHMWNEHLC